MALDAETKRLAKKRVEELRKNPPKVTQEHIEGAEKLIKQHEDFEKAKDKDIKNEIRAVSKDLADHVWTHAAGVGKLFHGIGKGKKVRCSFPGCGRHEGTMYNMNDGKWYDSEHRWFGNLNEEEKEKELSCLKTLQKTQ